MGEPVKFMGLAEVLATNFDVKTIRHYIEQHRKNIQYNRNHDLYDEFIRQAELAIEIRLEIERLRAENEQP